ncbi:MAG: HAMP domain-containing sensor histidine kinase [Planctomycetota bacterium]
MSRVPRLRSLGFRVGLLVFVATVVVDLGTYPLWTWLEGTLAPEWFDPATLRDYADHLESLTPDERAAERWSFTDFTAADLGILVAAVLVTAVLFAALLGALVSRLAARRVVDLTRVAALGSAEAEAVPGPFPVRGTDEIAALARTMNEMRGSIVTLLERLERRDRERREWIAEVSHDLRTPLTALGVSLDRAQPLFDDLDEPGRRATLASVLSAASIEVRRVQDLAEDLLEIARLDAGDPLHLEPVPVGELLREAQRELAPLAEQAGIELTLALGDGLLELHADGRRLMRALENLLLNSIQYARKRVELRAEREEDRIAILLRDDGEGLPERDGRVALAELHRHRGRRDSAGLGLEVARKVVAAHGGELVARNLPGGGASLELRFAVDA